MKYRVAFMERTDAEGNRTEKPAEYVELDLADGVVLDRNFVERIEPDSMHGEDVMEEDDDFESIATEVWEYDVADGRDQDFIAALKNSKMVIEYQALGDIDMIEPGKPA
jgi:hypothetical protein